MFETAVTLLVKLGWLVAVSAATIVLSAVLLLILVAVASVRLK